MDLLFEIDFVRSQDTANIICIDDPVSINRICCSRVFNKKNNRKNIEDGGWPGTLE